MKGIRMATQPSGPGGPLHGLLVVACEHAVAAPLATRHLADLGARVIKVERPGTGDFARHQAVRGMSSHFVWVNRGKQSLTLDLKSVAGQAVLARLLDRADAVVHNLGPGVAGRLGLGGQDLVRKYPRLIACEISGYGTTGPWRSRKAYDLMVQAEAGVLGITGSPDAPAKAGIPVADIAAAMYALSGVLTALYTRERTGRGGHIEVSLLDSLVEWMGYPFYYARYGGAPPPRSGAHHAAIAPYGPFRTADDKDILIAVQNDTEWEALCTVVLGQPELARDPRFASNPDRVASRDVLDPLVARAIAAIDLTEAERRCELARIAYARLGDVGDLERHPQLQARGRWTQVGSPAGPLAAAFPPWIISGRPADTGPVPDLGQHTSAILAELGYSAEDISGLRESGVV
jgi:crotonobetainyl-CoA:carnitine CoA-transferase CaiB-like acyl-CoA transferase